jgi:Na+/H+-dicarboxylate symporter
MKLYWSLKSFPELADLPKQKREEVWTNTYKKHWFKIKILPAITFGLCAVAGVAYGNTHYGYFGKYCGAIIGSGIGWCIAWQITVAIIRPYIREYLISHGKTNQSSL